METLGLASARKHEDNFFQRLLWPTIQNQYDVDIVGRRGFWLASVVGASSCLILALQGMWLIALFTLVVFLLGAAGIRERSIAGSSVVLVLYMVGVIGSWILSFLTGFPMGNPLVNIIFIMLLASNLRAVILSRQWLAIGADSEFPERNYGGPKDLLVNRYPRVVWPIGRHVFFWLAALYILLTVLGLYATKQRVKARGMIS